MHMDILHAYILLIASTENTTVKIVNIITKNIFNF